MFEVRGIEEREWSVLREKKNEGGTSMGCYVFQVAYVLSTC